MKLRTSFPTRQAENSDDNSNDDNNNDSNNSDNDEKRAKFVQLEKATQLMLDDIKYIVDKLVLKIETPEMSSEVLSTARILMKVKKVNC